MKALNFCLSALLGIALFFFILTASISLPIYFRSFYYMQIDDLNLEEESGYTEAQIIEAYDEVLDYLVLGKEFGTGDMPYSESGKSHFADCKVLFDLNLGVLIASTAIIVILFALEKFKVINILSGSHKPWFYTGIISVIALTSIALLASADFEKAFEVFHYIFFPGKDNWAFNPFTDEIIYVLPQEFFMNCAILIGSAMVFGFAACITADVLENKLTKKATCNENENQIG